MKTLFLILITLNTLFANMSRSENVVSDTSTNLQWQDDASVIHEDGVLLQIWTEAIASCNALILGGKDDWRLPNIMELLSIVDRSRYEPAINSTFVHVNSSFGSWSSTTFSENTGEAWVVNFQSAITFTSSKGARNIGTETRCVRGGQLDDLTPTSNKQFNATLILYLLN